MLEYVGIAGSDRYGSPKTFPASSGTLYFRSAASAADIRDGLSNTMVVGEYSGLAPGQEFNSIGGLGDNDASWHLGFCGGLPNTGSENTYSVRTVAYPPNTAWYTRNTWSCHECQTPLNGDGGPNARCARAALKSSHPGGIHVVLGDGAVTFLSNGIDISVYKDLADRDDGRLVGRFD